jgi:hypothetical protein
MLCPSARSFRAVAFWVLGQPSLAAAVPAAGRGGGQAVPGALADEHGLSDRVAVVLADARRARDLHLDRPRRPAVTQYRIEVAGGALTCHFAGNWLPQFKTGCWPLMSSSMRLLDVLSRV